MPMNIPPSVVEVCRVLQAAGHQALVVGGAVRSLLIQQKVPDAPGPKDYDIATSARPEDVQRLFPRTIPTGIAHGTLTVLLGEDPGSAEVTTFRTEGAYSDGRRPDSVSFVGDLRADLARRDFTVNAIAYDPVSRALQDPFEGRKDIEDKLLRAVGSPVERFSEDGLRLLRAARFAAQLNFSLDQHTYEALGQCAPLLRKVSRERVRDELLKLLSARAAARGLDLLFVSGLLREVAGDEIARVLDFSVPFGHWARLVAHAPHEHKLAAFLWPLRDKPSEADRVLGTLKLANAQRSLASRVLRFPKIVDPLDAGVAADFVSRVAVRRVMAAHSAEVLDGAVALQLLDHQESGLRGAICVFWEDVQDERGKKSPLRLADLALSGDDLIQMGVSPGPRLGQVLAALMEAVLRDPEMNDRDLLIGLVMGMQPLGAP